MTNYQHRYNGRIKFYNEEKCFGFLIRADNNEEYFISKLIAERAGITARSRGDDCTFILKNENVPDYSYVVDIRLNKKVVKNERI